MKRIPVVSSSLASVGYDAATRSLEVEFVGGAVYGYDDVPPELYYTLVGAPSAGKFFARVVRGKYQSRVLVAAPKTPPAAPPATERFEFSEERLITGAPLVGEHVFKVFSPAGKGDVFTVGLVAIAAVGKVHVRASMYGEIYQPGQRLTFDDLGRWGRCHLGDHRLLIMAEGRCFCFDVRCHGDAAVSQISVFVRPGGLLPEPLTDDELAAGL